MKTVKTKTIKVISRTLELTKRPKLKNLAGRNVSISYEERSEVQDNDMVILKVFNPDNEQIAEKTFTAKQFRKGLVEREKRTRGAWKIKYFTLEY